TYFPAEARYGMISFPDLLRRIQDLYKSNPEKVAKSAAEVSEALRQYQQMPGGEVLPDAEAVFDSLYQQLNSSFDSQQGGFGQAPKFPHAGDIDFLMQLYHYTGNRKSLGMALFTLQKMAAGGIYDQVGGGFHRYSTDEKWLVPHFEKMLYDNALLAPLYADAYRLTGEMSYRRTAESIIDFVLRELQDAGGGFYATLDADSEGKEGIYYVWSAQELAELLEEDLKKVFFTVYDISQEGNWEGRNILQAAKPVPQAARELHLSPAETEKKLQQAKKIILKARQKRVRPGLDNKILADWNGMMISALLQVYQLNEDKTIAQSAEKALDFLLNNYLDDQMRLAHFVKNEKERIPGYLDDYAWLVRALLDAFETLQNPRYLSIARELTDSAIKKFWDDQNGGFYFTAEEADNTITRLRQNYDASTPAGNHIMTGNLLRLSAYSGNKNYREKAETVFRIYADDLEKRSAALSSLVTALLYFHYQPLEVTLYPGSNEHRMQEIQRLLGELYIPNKISLDASVNFPAGLLDPMLIKGGPEGDDPAVILCYRQSCSLPLKSLREISRALENLDIFVQRPQD
ncbi:MAG: thioredoxin domain-containing protein, partial [Calditrichia bacterium]